MNLDAVITQLKTYAPVFNGNVAGAAQFALAVEDQGWLPRPAAYVIPLEDETEANANQTGLYQLVREKIGIIVDLDNAVDRRGQAAAPQAVNAIRPALRAAVRNRRPDPATPAAWSAAAWIGPGCAGSSISRSRPR